MVKKYSRVRGIQSVRNQMGWGNCSVKRIPVEIGEEKKQQKETALQREWSVFRMLLASRKTLDLVFGFVGIVGKCD